MLGEVKMFYRLEYDKVLNSTQIFLNNEKNERIGGLALVLRFDKIFFLPDEFMGENFEQLIEINGEEKTLNSFVKVSYDNQNKRFSFKDEEGFTIDYKVVEYNKHVIEEVESEISKELAKLTGYKMPMAIPTIIEKEEFDTIVKTYGNLFENDQSLQCCSYAYQEINIFKNYEELVLNNYYFVESQQDNKIFVAQYQEDTAEGFVWEIETKESIEWVGLTEYKPTTVERVFEYYFISPPCKNKIKEREYSLSGAKYVLSSYVYYEKNKGLIRYDQERMNQLCSQLYGEYYVSEFQKVNKNSEDKEYIYNTFSKTGEPIQTCGVVLDIKENERIMKL